MAVTLRGVISRQSIKRYAMLPKDLIIQLRTILSKNKIDEEGKEDLVLQFTNGGTKSIREMRKVEAIAMIRALNDTPDTYDDSANRKRRQILALCHEMGWEDDQGRVDMTRVNAYCTTRGYLKKPLNDYKPGELQKLVSQFKTMHKNYLRNGNNTTV